MKKAIFATTLTFIFVSCLGKFFGTGNTNSDLLNLIDSSKKYYVTPSYSFISTPESVTFYNVGGINYSYRCTFESSAGGMGPDYENYDIPIQRNFGAAIRLKINYSQNAQLPTTDCCIGSLDPLGIIPANDSAYFTSFLDIDSLNIVVFKYGDRSISRIYKENVGLVYEMVIKGSSVPMNSNWRRCVLSEVNNVDFEPQMLLSRIIGMQYEYQKYNREDSTILNITSIGLDSIVFFPNASTPQAYRHSITTDTIFKFVQGEYFMIRTYPTDSLILPYQLNYKIDTIQINGNNISVIKGHPFYSLNW